MPFSKGFIPWNKNKRYKCEAISIAKKGASPWNKGLKGIVTTGERNGKWKGDKVNYYALHHWLRSVLGKPAECVFCGECIKNLEWASVSHQAKRDINDYISLCISCHRKYDHPKYRKENAFVWQV